LLCALCCSQRKLANEHNAPGEFTTVIAFEWTSIPAYQNLHNNVFFRDDEAPDTQFSDGCRFVMCLSR